MKEVVCETDSGRKLVCRMPETVPDLLKISEKDYDTVIQATNSCFSISSKQGQTNE